VQRTLPRPAYPHRACNCNSREAASCAGREIAPETWWCNTRVQSAPRVRDTHADMQWADKERRRGPGKDQRATGNGPHWSRAEFIIRSAADETPVPLSKEERRRKRSARAARRKIRVGFRAEIVGLSSFLDREYSDSRNPCFLSLLSSPPSRARARASLFRRISSIRKSNGGGSDANFAYPSRRELFGFIM